MRKKLISLFILMTMLASIFSFTFATSVGASDISMEGSGTPEDPYLVKECYQLYEVSNLLEGNFLLNNDINCTNFNVPPGSIEPSALPDLQPIGDNDTPFIGIFDGDNHTITGLEINHVGECTGLFGRIGSAASVYDLNLTDANIIGESYTGILVGCNEGIVNNIDVSGSVIGDYYVGGFAGINEGTSTINNSSSSASVDTVYYTGGFIGQIEQNASVANSFVTGDVSVTDGYSGSFVGVQYGDVANSYATGNINDTSNDGSVGGFVGYFSGGNISRSAAHGKVITGGDKAGGFVGEFSSGSIVQSYATGNVEAAGIDVGGFTGYATDESSAIDTYARGNAAGGDSVGGHTGNKGTSVLISSYSTGIPTSGVLLGGFVATSGLETTLANFWDKESSGVSETVLDTATAKTTLEMKTQSTFTEWNFDEIWVIDGGNDGYPRFQWDERSSDQKTASYTDPQGKQVRIDYVSDCVIGEFVTQPESSNALQDFAYDYKQDLIHFTLNTCDIGESLQIRLTFVNANASGKTVRKYMPNANAYYTLADAQITQQANDVVVTYKVSDGGVLDVDGAANGTIVDPVGIGEVALGVPKTGLGGTSKD